MTMTTTMMMMMMMMMMGEVRTSISRIMDFSLPRPFAAGVTGRSIPDTRLYPGLNRARLDYTPVYYVLG